MANIFAYEFMHRAFLVAVLIALTAPCIGVTIVLKRLSAIGDAASHSALAGIAMGIVMGINPVLGAVVFSVLAVMSIEIFRKKFNRYPEIATVVVMSAGIGLTALISGFVTDSSENLNSFFFGSIVAISDFELYMTVVLAAAVLVITGLLYKEIFYITFDEPSAQLAGIPVKGINFVIMLLTAITVSVASRAVGALMISSLLVIPVAAAMLISKSYKGTLVWSIVFAQIFTISGLVISFYANLRPGGTIVLLGVAVLVVLMIIKGRRS